jgi:hypothetical protein
LYKVNVATKQTSTVTLSTNTDIQYSDLVFDKANNLYSIKLEFAGGKYIYTLVRLEQTAGAVTPISTLSTFMEDLVYLPATNEIAGLMGGSKIYKVNLSTQGTSSLVLTSKISTFYYGLVADKKSNLYGYKVDSSDPNKAPLEIVQLDAVTGSATVLEKLDQADAFNTNFYYDPQFNNLYCIYKNRSVYWYNLNKTGYGAGMLTNAQNIAYGYLTGN